MRISRRLTLLSCFVMGTGMAQKVQAQCAVTTTLAFIGQPSNVDWKAHTPMAVPATSSLTNMGSSGYASGAPTADALLDTQVLNGVQTLYWHNVYTPASTVASRLSTITFTFNRPVDNLQIQLQDVDAASGFIDEVTFSGFSGGAAVPVTLSKPLNSTVNIAGAVATGTTNVMNATFGNVTASFTGSITTLTLKYRNITAESPTQQAVGIDQLSWCRTAPLAANVTNGATMLKTDPAMGIDPLSATSEGSVASFTVTQIPAATKGVLTYYYAGIMGIGAGYNNVTNGMVLTPTEANSMRFDPKNPYTGGNAVFYYKATDDAGLTSDAATFTIPIAGALPVELTKFEAKAVKGAAQLSWSTASEKGNDHFDIERSRNGTSFEKIGQVAGHGSESMPANYSFLDASGDAMALGLVYYRLLQVDANGTTAYSPICTVRFGPGAEPALSVYPNPASAADRTVILDLSTLPQGAYQASLLDATGRVLATYPVEGSRTSNVSVQGLPAGAYLLRVRGQGLSLTQYLIK